jgi:ankyrin repeat protein
LEEERLRREEEAAAAAEAQARADKIKEEDNQKKADRERAERERIASENKAAQQEAASISEQDFRFAAGRRGRLEDVVSFIDRHPDKVNSPDANRWTALHEAARAGNTEIIQVLLEAGADVALTTKSGQNALQLLEGTHGPTHPAASILRQGYLKSKKEEMGENTATSRSEL